MNEATTQKRGPSEESREQIMAEAGYRQLQLLEYAPGSVKDATVIKLKAIKITRSVIA